MAQTIFSNLLRYGIPLLALFSLSCGNIKNEEENDLIVTVDGSDAFLYNTGMKSCNDIATGATGTGSIAAQSFEVQGVHILWNTNSGETLTLISVNIELRGTQLANGSMTSKIDMDTEIPLAFSPGYKTILSPHDEIQTHETSGGCDLRAGGVSVTTLGRLAGRVVVKGFTKSGHTLTSYGNFTLHIIEPSTQ